MMNSRPTRNNEKKGLVRRFSTALSKLTSNRFFLMGFSLVIAFTIWAVMVASDGTLRRRKVFANTPVNVTGEATLTSRGYIVTDNIQKLVPGVDLIVEVTQANYERATVTSYNPHFELTQITGEGENTLSIVYSSQAFGQVISCVPNTVTVNVERYVTRRVPVLVEQTGTLPDGYYLKTYKVEPIYLSVSGPQSIVTTISRVIAHLNLSDLTPDRMSDRLALDIELQRSDGSVVVEEKLTVTNQSVITSSVVVETELIPLREIPLEKEAFVTGKPATGYALKEIELAESSIPVAAPQEILDALNMITTDTPLDITDATETVSGFVRLRRLTGIETTLPQEIAVKAVIEEETLSKQFKSVNVQLKGQTGQKVSLTPNRVNVRLTGPYSFIRSLTADQISLYVDVSGRTEGTWMLPLEIVVDNAPNYIAEPDTSEIQAVITVQQDNIRP